MRRPLPSNCIQFDEDEHHVQSNPPRSHADHRQEGRGDRGQDADQPRDGDRHRKDASGKTVPRRIIKQFVAKFNGKEIMKADWHPAISANPYQSFFVQGARKRHLRVHLARRQRLGLQVRAQSDRRLRLRSRLASGSFQDSNAARVMGRLIGAQHDVRAAAHPKGWKQVITRRDFIAATAAAGTLCAGTGLPLSGWQRRDASRKSNSWRSSRTATSRSCTSPTSTPSSCRCISASRRSISASARRRASCPISSARSCARPSSSPTSRPRRTRTPIDDFAELARTYGRMGGLDRIATVIKSIRAAARRPHAAARRRRHLDQLLDRACRPRARTWSMP